MRFGANCTLDLVCVRKQDAGNYVCMASIGNNTTTATVDVVVTSMSVCGNVQVCTCACIHMCVCVWVWVCVGGFRCLCVGVGVSVCVCVCARVCGCVCVCMCVCVWVWVYVCNVNVQYMIYLSLTGPPGPPSNVTVEYVTEACVALSWTPPTDDGGAPITKFTILVMTENDELISTQDCDATEVSCVLENLDPSTIYLFRVRACNELGPGEPSMPSAPVALAIKPLFQLRDDQFSDCYDVVKVIARYGPQSVHGGIVCVCVCASVRASVCV